jgi:hypothetical protein
VLDAELREVPDGEVGTLWLGGMQVMPGAPRPMTNHCPNSFSLPVFPPPDISLLTHLHQEAPRHQLGQMGCCLFPEAWSGCQLLSPQTAALAACLCTGPVRFSHCRPEEGAALPRGPDAAAGLAA